jgi:hypothetical protein
MEYGWGANHGFGKGYLPLDGPGKGPKMLHKDPMYWNPDEVYTSREWANEKYRTKMHDDGENAFG